MKLRIPIAIALVALLLLPAAAFAQKAKPAAVSVTLEYYEDNSGQFRVVDAAKKDVADLQFGMTLKPGWTIVTDKGDYAELKVTHTGTIIKVSQNTNFAVTALRDDKGGQDVFSLGVGKIRTVAGKASGKDKYQIRTPVAVCGVRGSDAGFQHDPDKGTTGYCLEGTGWMQRQGGEELDIPAGFMADSWADIFKIIEIPADLMSNLLKELGFTKLNPAEALALNKQWHDEQKALEDKKAEEPSGDKTAGPPTGEPGDQSPGQKASATSGVMDGVMEKLREILGMEIGSVTIDGNTYAKVVVQPTFKIGDLKMALYLPVIYQSNMFDVNDWYKPAGNNEWSFGTDAKYSGDPWGMASDILSDLMLKIRYIEWGQQRDPFFFKVGNLNDITIGHGLIMRDFANDADFPAVRTVGLNVGLDGGGVGFEAMVNNAAFPEVMGGRVFFRPIPNFKAAIGLSAIVDLNPAKDFYTGSAVDAAAAGSPIFINPGVDLDVPFVESDFFSMVAFADGAVMIPYFRTAPTAVAGISQGFAWNAIYDASASMPIKNWGAAAGLFGNLVFKDLTYRVEFRDYTGVFKPQFYSANYERERSQYVTDVLAYLQDTGAAAYNKQTMGVYGEGGYTLDKIFSLKLGYFWPWEVSNGVINTSTDDSFIATFRLEKGVIPVVNLWGEVTYERTQFASTIMSGGFLNNALFDANTLVSAAIYYTVNSNIDVMLRYTTTAKRDSSGNIVYNSGSLLPEMNTAMSVETQIHL